MVLEAVDVVHRHEEVVARREKEPLGGVLVELVALMHPNINKRAFIQRGDDVGKRSNERAERISDKSYYNTHISLYTTTDTLGRFQNQNTPK